MTDYVLPILFVILLWWSSTGAILWLARGMDKQMSLRLIGMTVLCALGFTALIISTLHETVWAVYVAFVSALIIWGWVEFTFLAGLITGKTKIECPENINETSRFVHAFNVINHHEFTLLGALVVIGLIDMTGGSAMASKTFACMWLMRIGAKFAIFSGVPKLSVEMMPERLAYLQTYFRSDRIGWGFWASITGCTLFFASGLYALTHVDYGSVAETQTIMLTALVGLAVIEHFFMVLPVADSRLWSWAMPNSRTNKTNKKGKTQQRIAAE
jgi:putative photosynthetic complex assembly protein 2